MREEYAGFAVVAVGISINIKINIYYEFGARGKSYWDGIYLSSS